MKRTELRTERLLLRPFQAGDVDASLAYRDDPAFAQFLPHIPQPFTRHDAEAFVAQNMSEPWTTLPTFAVVLDGQLIGTVNFEIDAHAHSATLGYALGRAWWGQGFATEAARAALVWAASAYSLAQVCASADARNVGSQRVLEKLGMRREAIRTGDGVGRDGQGSDSVTYSLDLRDAQADEKA